MSIFGHTLSNYLAIIWNYVSGRRLKDTYGFSLGKARTFNTYGTTKTVAMVGYGPTVTWMGSTVSGLGIDKGTT